MHGLCAAVVESTLRGSLARKPEEVGGVDMQKLVWTINTCMEKGVGAQLVLLAAIAGMGPDSYVHTTLATYLRRLAALTGFLSQGCDKEAAGPGSAVGKVATVAVAVEHPSLLTSTSHMQW